MRVLIAYASRYGTTKGIAERLAAVPSFPSATSATGPKWMPGPAASRKL